MPIKMVNGKLTMVPDEPAKSIEVEVVETITKIDDTAPLTNVDECDAILHRVNGILREYNGESNIPHNHDYWDLMNMYRKLLSER